MARPKKLDPTAKVSIYIARSKLTKLQLILFSDVDGRIPHGAQQEFWEARLDEWFETTGNALLAMKGNENADAI